MYPHHVFDLEPVGTFGMYPICYQRISGRYFQPEPAMYARCFHWFPGPLSPSVHYQWCAAVLSSPSLQIPWKVSWVIYKILLSISLSRNEEGNYLMHRLLSDTIFAHIFHPCPTQLHFTFLTPPFSVMPIFVMFLFYAYLG